MSRQRISSCCGCERCIGVSCPNHKDDIAILCDNCGERIDIDYNSVYSTDGKNDICETCLLEMFEKDV